MGAQGEESVSNIRRAVIAAALACAALLPSFALARGGGGGGHSGGGHAAGGHFGFSDSRQVGGANRVGSVARTTGHVTHAHHSGTRLASRKHSRSASSRNGRTGSKVVNRPPRGDGPGRGDGPPHGNGRHH